MRYHTNKILPIFFDIVLYLYDKCILKIYTIFKYHIVLDISHIDIQSQQPLIWYKSLKHVMLAIFTKDTNLLIPHKVTQVQYRRQGIRSLCGILENYLGKMCLLRNCKLPYFISKVQRWKSIKTIELAQMLIRVQPRSFKHGHHHEGKKFK